MKTFKYFAFVIAMIASIGFIASCSSDSDSDDKDSAEASELIGSWVVNEVTTYEWPFRNWEGVTMTFKSGGKMTMRGDVWGSGTDLVKGSYKVSGNKLTIKADDEDLPALNCKYEIDDLELILTVSLANDYGSGSGSETFHIFLGRYE